MGPNGSPKVRVGARENYPPAARREGRGEVHDRIVQELRFVDGNHLGQRIQALGDLRGRVHRHRLGTPAVMTGDRINPSISTVEVRLEDLHSFPCDDCSTDATNELLALATEHHARDDLDPSSSELKSGHVSSRRGRRAFRTRSPRSLHSSRSRAALGTRPSSERSRKPPRPRGRSSSRRGRRSPASRSRPNPRGARSPRSRERSPPNPRPPSRAPRPASRKPPRRASPGPERRGPPDSRLPSRPPSRERGAGRSSTRAVIRRPLIVSPLIFSITASASEDAISAME